MTRRRAWAFRIVAMLLPLLLLGALELAFLVFGAYGPESDENPHVSFVTDEDYFPRWERTLAMPKPEGTLRIFALGGSTTMGSGSERPFVHHLRARLARELPGRRVEVVNGGMVAFGSHRIFEVMKEAAEFDPDLYVVYLGHNEFLEEIFFDPEGLLAQQERLARLARSFRVVNFLRSLFGDVSPPKPKLQRHFFGNTAFPLIRSDEQYRLRLEFLRTNVRQMIRFARARGAVIVLSPAVPNLLWEPGNPEHGPGYAARSGEWDAAFGRGRRAFRAGDDRAAIAAFREAHGIDDRHALSWWCVGLAHLSAGETEAGVDALLRANLLDRRGDRANSDVADVIREVSAEEGAVLHDFWPVFLDAVPDDFRRIRTGAGEPLFVDHCHPGDRGHEMIGRAFARRVVETLR